MSATWAKIPAIDFEPFLSGKSEVQRDIARQTAIQMMTLKLPA